MQINKKDTWAGKTDTSVPNKCVLQYLLVDFLVLM